MASVNQQNTTNTVEFDIFSLIATCKDAAIAAGDAIVTIFEKNNGKVNWMDKAATTPTTAPSDNNINNSNNNNKNEKKDNTESKSVNDNKERESSDFQLPKLVRRRSSLLRDTNALYKLDPRTFADEQAHHTIVGSIKKHFPQCIIKSEEDNDDNNKNGKKEENNENNENSTFINDDLILQEPTISLIMNNDDNDTNIKSNNKNDDDNTQINILNKINENEEWYKNIRSIKCNDIVIWVDPMDGTKAYIKGEKTAVTVLIGIANNKTGECIAGVIHRPFTNHTVIGIVGYGLITYGYESISLNHSNNNNNNSNNNNDDLKSDGKLSTIVNEINATLKENDNGNSNTNSNVNSPIVTKPSTPVSSNIKREFEHEDDGIITMKQDEMVQLIRQVSNHSVDLNIDDIIITQNNKNSGKKRNSIDMNIIDDKKEETSSNDNNTRNDLSFMTNYDNILKNIIERSQLKKGNKRMITTKIHFTDDMKSYLKSIVLKFNSKLDDIIQAGGAGNKVLLLIEGFGDAFLFPNKGTKKWDTCAPQAIIQSIKGYGKFTQPNGNIIKYNENVEKNNSNGFIVTIYGDEYHDKLLLMKK